MTTTLPVSAGQSLADIAVQVYGDVAAVFELADDNGLTITAALAPGQLLSIDPARVVSPQIVAYLAGRGVVVNNDAAPTELLPPDPGPDPGGPTPDFHHPDFYTPDFD